MLFNAAVSIVFEKYIMKIDIKKILKNSYKKLSKRNSNSDKYQLLSEKNCDN